MGRDGGTPRSISNHRRIGSLDPAIRALNIANSFVRLQQSFRWEACSYRSRRCQRSRPSSRPLTGDDIALR